MNRRSFLAALSCLPFVGKYVPQRYYDTVVVTGVWNRLLTEDEMAFLNNAGQGLTYAEGWAPDVTFKPGDRGLVTLGDQMYEFDLGSPVTSDTD